MRRALMGGAWGLVFTAWSVASVPTADASPVLGPSEPCRVFAEGLGGSTGFLANPSGYLPARLDPSYPAILPPDASPYFRGDTGGRAWEGCHAAGAFPHRGQWGGSAAPFRHGTNGLDRADEREPDAMFLVDLQDADRSGLYLEDAPDPEPSPVGCDTVGLEGAAPGTVFLISAVLLSAGITLRLRRRRGAGAEGPVTGG